jgi:MFS transporter, FHS family, glucose/mannose:H+ symporter
MDRIEAPRRELTRRRAATVSILAGFVVAGVVTTLLGPILPFLINRWSLTDQQAGLFFTFQFGGSMAGVASLSDLLPRWGYKFVLVAGFVAIALGVAGLNARTHLGGLAGTALYGYGLGFVLSSSNLWMAEAAESRRVAALSILNFTWGIGAIACPALVLLAAHRTAVPAFLYFVAAFALAAALVLPAVGLNVPLRRADRAVESHEISASKMGAIALGALFFLYVGTENCVAGWAAAFARRMGEETHGIWALAPMFFWGGLMAGRAFVPVNPLRKREKLLVSIGLVMGLAGSATLLTIRSFWALAFCVALAGLGFAAIYPVLVAWMAEHFGARARRIGSVMFFLAGLGGAVMPWTVGFFSTREGSLRSGLLVPAAGCVVMLALLLWIPEKVAC